MALFAAFLPIKLFATELWMVYPRTVRKERSMEIKIYFGDYGKKVRPFFGRITLYVKDPLGKSYKVPLRREEGFFSTVVIPDVPGPYRLRCVGNYFGDRFVSSGKFFVTSFLRKPGPKDFDEKGGEFLGVTEEDDAIKFTSPKVCSGGVWVVKGSDGKVLLRDEGVDSISVPFKLGAKFVVVYSCGDWTFSYLYRGEGL